MIPLTVEARGEIIASNVDEFREMVAAALATINREPASDEEFGQAEQDVKALKEAEKAVTEAKAKALEDAADIQRLFATLDETSDEIREARLELERQVKAKKSEVRERIIKDALDDIGETLQVKPGGFRGEIESAVKGKRTIDGMVGSASKACAIVIRRVNEARKLIDAFEDANGKELTLDRAELELKGPDPVAAELRRRLDLARAEAEKRRLREEKEKAERELNQKAEAAKEEVRQTAKPELPKPRKIDGIPTTGSVAGEWAGFETAVMVAFQPLKEARAKLKHPENKEKAFQFAKAVNAAWKEVTA